MTKFSRKATALVAGSVIVFTSALVAVPAASAAEQTPTRIPAVSQASAPAVAPSLTSKQKKFVRWVRSQDSSLSLLSAKDTVDLGKQTCKALQAGASGDDVISVYVDSGFTDNQTIALISGSVIYLCPGQSYKFD